MIVVPDVGCGVFGNDPFVIGGCLGSVLRRHRSSLGVVTKAHDRNRMASKASLQLD